MEHRQVLILRGKMGDELRIGNLAVEIDKDSLIIRLPADTRFQMGDTLFSVSHHRASTVKVAIDAPRNLPVSHLKKDRPE